MPERTDAAKSSMISLASEVLFWPARILALLVVVTCPWYYGSVSWYSQSVYVPIVLVIFLLAITGAALRKVQFGNPLVWSLAALLGLVLLQTLPLPNWLWRTVSAGAAFENQADEIVAQLTASVPAGLTQTEEKQSQVDIQAEPRTLSINWVQSRASAATFAMALAWLIASIILFRSAGWETVLIGVLAITGLAIAFLGLLQAVAWNNWTLLPMPTETHFATFVSRNSGPQFLAIGLGSVLGLLVWWSHSKKDNVDKKYYVRYPAVNALARMRRRLDDLVIDLDAISIVCIFAATFMFVAVLAAASRGGILACIAAAAVTLGFTLGTKTGVLRTSGLIIIVACSTLILLTTLELDDSILARLDTVNQEAYMLNNGRIDVWRMILSAPSCWIPGCGLGNFHFAILPTYRQGPSAWFYHAENVYIEMLAEFGLLGFVVGVGGLAWLLARIRWCAVKGRRAAPSFIALVFALTVIGLQSLVDFSLIIPGIFLSFLALVGCFLGRSGASDYGKQKQDAKQRARMRTSSESSPRRSDANNQVTIAGSLVAIVLVLIATGVGVGPLRGFAFAEQIAAKLQRQAGMTKAGNDGQAVSAEQILRSLDPAKVASYSAHPEVNVQVGRALQNYFEESFVQGSFWPSEWTIAQRRALSLPETVAASFRAKEGTLNAQLKQLVAQQPHLLETLQRSFNHFAAASNVSKWDWRPSWGLLRSDLNTLTPESRIRNYAQLALVTGHNPTLPSQVAGAALFAGENSTGLVLLQRYLTQVPGQTKVVVSPLLDLLTPVEMQQVLPTSQLIRADLARDLAQSPLRLEFAEQLVKDIDLQVVTSEAERASNVTRRAATWLVVAWVAAEKERLLAKDSEVASQVAALQNSQVAALGNAVAAAPLNHNIRYQRAKLLSLLDRKQEALEEAKRALRQDPQNASYKELVDEIEQIVVPTDETN